MSRKPITRTDRKVIELKLRDMLKKEKDKFQDMQNQAVKYMVERDILKKALNIAIEDKIKIENELLTEQFGAETKLLNPYKEDYYLERAKENIIELVGNIYDNPELLKKEK